MLTIIAKMIAKKGKENETYQALTKLIQPTRAEKGNRAYDLHQQMDDTRVFFFYEVWESEANFQAHTQSKHILAYREKMNDLLDEREVYPLKKVD
ncbi:antibiotic biosynthesis monooxygenase [Hazenella sp. IB182357]|uniref:Antibiotic biosynthesis monooxygenase n=1 Tax=Polycladospora coralii TaxID=2771432 RepID=A0A926NFL7_9BACL|nr:putative quinol monooxygenase [Polycladospora coralii]MBD1372654.1 antibiotic biosynthesis monooxygenase [Polycladospora coralii]